MPAENEPIGRIDIDGRALRYVSVGTGPPVVLLHAFPFRAEFWEPQFALAGEGCRVVAPDLRGFGQSSRQALRGGECVDEPARSMADYAGDIVRLLDDLAIEQAVVCGLSMGGYVAFALQRLAPRRIRALVLADTRAEADSEEGRRARSTLLAALAERGTVAVADAMMPKMLSPATRVAQPELEPAVRAMMESASPDGVADAITCLRDRVDSSETLRAVDVPVQLIVGRDDEVTTVAMHDRMQSLLPDSNLTVIERAGHLSNLEQPDVFNRTVGRFLKGLSWCRSVA
ncbi:MAG: alpha/beta fold hydrolase [Vicinamibacterales bacterium]